MKALPQCLDVERAFLGILIAHEEKIPTALQEVRASDLSLGHHQHIYALISQMFGDRESIDSVTVALAVLKSPALYGGVGYVSAVLPLAFSSGEALPGYIAKIIEASMSRSIIITMQKSIDAAHADQRPDKNIDQVISDLSAIRRTSSSGPTHVGAMINASIERKRAQARTGKSPKLSSGIDELDRFLYGGFARKSVTVLAARPSMGKTALALNIATNVARRGEPVAFFELEMDDDDTTDRIVADVGDVSVHFLQDPRKMGIGHWRGLDDANMIMEKIPFRIQSRAGVTMAQIRGTCLEWAMQMGPLKLIVIDYLGLVRHTAGDLVEGLGGIMKDGLRLSKEMGCPVIFLHQLSRAVEKRDIDKRRPVIGDLRDSGHIEQDADNILLLYRDAFYNKNADIRGAEVIIAKARGAVPGKAILRWNGEKQRFTSPMKRETAHAERTDSSGLDSEANRNGDSHQGVPEGDRGRQGELPMAD